MTFAAASFGTVHFREAGNPDRLPLVFCNSLGTDARIWDGVIERLAPDFRLISYDKRGHGLSSVPSGPYDIAQLASDLLDLVDLLELERFALAGVSIGGLVAQQFALDHPDRLAGLVLCDTLAKFGDAAQWSDRIARVAAGGMEAIADMVLLRWFPMDIRQGREAEILGWRNLLLRSPADGYIATCAVLSEADLTSRVGTIAMPTLVLCGECDQATPLEAVWAFANQLPKSRFVSIAGAGHLPSIDQPDRVAQLIRDYLQEVSNA
jgi:3-oxoadipate enol-lactonase